MNPYTTSASPPPRPTFDSSLFSMAASGSPSLSQPYQPTLPAVRNNNSRLPNGKRPASPSSLHPDHSLLTNSPSTLSATSPITNSSFYNNMGFPRGPGSHYSPNPSYYDHSTGGRHSLDDESPTLMDRFTTTPNFEDVEMPPLADDDVYELDDGLSGTAYSTPATGVGGGRMTFPPSPRPTISPSPGIGSSGNEDVQIKVEQFTPSGPVKGLGVHIQHPTPISHASSASSSNPVVKSPPPVVDLTVDKRGEDGAWVGGYDPEMRAALGAGGDAAEIPSLNEQTINQQREFKALEIQDWLRKNSDTAFAKDSKDGKPGGLTVKAPKRGRAKSFSDFRNKSSSAKGTKEKEIVKVGESSAGAVTGVLVIDEDDIRPGEYDYEEDDSSDGSLSNDGSLDDDEESMNTSEAPPTEEALKRTEKEQEEEQMRIDNDPTLLPNPKQFYSARPWIDTVGHIPSGTNAAAMKCQPHTANAAISRFREYAQNIETASRVATFGSETSKIRRLSASDVDRIAADGGLLKRLSFRNKEKGQDKDVSSPPGHSRRPSLMQSLMRTSLKRGHSNASDKLRENNTEVVENEAENETLLGDAASFGRKRGDSVASSASATSFAPVKTRTSWSKPGTLKVDTSVHGAIVSMAGITAGIGQSSGHTASTAKSASPTPAEKRTTGLSVGSHVMQQLRRARSKSELATGSRLHKNNKPSFGIVSMLGQYGGPPLVPIKSPVVSGDSAPDSTLKPRFTFGEETSKRGLAAANQSLLSPPDPHRHDGYDDSDDEVMDDTLNRPPQAPPPGQRQQKLDITPNVEGFTAHIKSKTPELHYKLVERIVYEQGKRYKKLVEHRQKHLAAIRNGGKCSNNAKCRGNVGSIGAGGQEENNGHKRNISAGSPEGEAYSSDETAGDHSPTEGKVAATQFPSGVPQPPVSRLPAEFECPICFKVKKFTKPSDWTKHVHEDVHPFTCTFSECTEPKSFKRKADWVRHENERHRHLEWWTCNIPDCTHTCYRKDNFVQHLVREHKMAEPKIKAQKAAAKAAGKSTGKKGKVAKAVAGADGAPTKEDFDKVWQIVDDCHQQTAKLPTAEKCRFCGVTCATWKKLTVHLARHMEQISLPVLDLITDDAVVPPSTRGSAKQAPARSANTAPVAPMPKTQHLSTDMDIDSIGGGAASGQRHHTVDVQYGGGIQYTGGNTNYGSHHTPPQSSPHIPMDNHFNVSTPPQGGPQYSTPGSLGFGPDGIQNMQNVPGLHPMLNQFEYAGNDMYPSPSSMTGARAPSINSGYSPSPTYSQRPPPHSPASQRMGPVMPGQQHLQVQQQQQPQQQSYFAYGHASGQLPANSALGVGQMHAQTVATANSLIENHGQYGYYPGGEIPMALMGVAMAPLDNEDYGFIH
ncbi:hypothetical protein DFP73DRAFT_591350 [Morchella snyderi]|nr:hypothetical protein DFP73DRAFT_591350 [Morchella snyderi]